MMKDPQMTLTVSAPAKINLSLRTVEIVFQFQFLVRLMPIRDPLVPISQFETPTT